MKASSRGLSGLVLCGALFAGLTAGSKANPLQGEIDGAPYVLWLPEPAVKRADTLLVLAPDQGSINGPRTAVLDLTDPTIGALHSAGWVIAVTGYRSESFEIEAGVADVVALAAYAEARHGRFRHRFVQGAGRGGAVVVRLFEEPLRAADFSGALVVGAGLVEFKGPPISDSNALSVDDFTFLPHRPILFLSHRDDLAGPLAYLAKAGAGSSHRFVAAAAVDRPKTRGFTPEELRRAWHHLSDWASGEPPALLAEFTTRPQTSAVPGPYLGKSLRRSITRIDPDYGNIDLHASLADLQTLGLELGASVGIRGPSGLVIGAILADRYAAVPLGEWVLVVLPDQTLRLAINRGHAGKALRAEEGLELELIAPASP